jgi:hypothetical protein
MKKDLMSDFFKRSLSEEEKGRLGELLESSPDDADRFADLAEEEYRASGYPDPLARKPFYRNLSNEVKMLALAALLALSVVGVVGWAFWNSVCRVQSADTVKIPMAKTPPMDGLGEGVASSIGLSNSGTYPAKPKVPQLKVTLPQPGPLSVVIYDSKGKPVRGLVSGVYSVGVHRFPWDEKNNEGRRVKPGRYRAVILRGQERSEVPIRVGD